MKLSRFHFSLIITFVGYSCSFFNRPNFPVEQYKFSGLRVVFAELEDSYKRSKNFNKIWSKIHKNRYRPYFRFAGKSYIVDGILNKYKQGFLILKDENGKYYEMNMLIYVALHELAHVLCDEIGHTDKFKRIFEDLLIDAENKGIYNPNTPPILDYCNYN